MFPYFRSMEAFFDLSLPNYALDGKYHLDNNDVECGTWTTALCHGQEELSIQP